MGRAGGQVESQVDFRPKLIRPWRTGSRPSQPQEVGSALSLPLLEARLQVFCQGQPPWSSAGEEGVILKPIVFVRSVQKIANGPR